jgi:hypothetical protein
VIVRGPQPTDHYFQVHNATARDRRLSFRARGVLAYILSLPPNAKTTVEAIAREGTEGREAVRKAMAELEAQGYVKRVKERDGRGQVRTDTHVFGTPQEARGTDDRPTGFWGPVSPGETRESPGHTGTQETVLRSTGSQKKKTGTTENEEENEPQGARSASSSPRSSQSTRGVNGQNASGLTPGTASTPQPPASAHSAEARRIADHLAQNGKAVTDVRRMVATLKPFLAKGVPAAKLQAVALPLYHVTEGTLGVALSNAERPGARTSKPAPRYIGDVLAAQEPEPEPSPEELAKRAADRAAVLAEMRRRRAEREGVLTPTLGSPEEVSA